MSLKKTWGQFARLNRTIDSSLVMKEKNYCTLLLVCTCFLVLFPAGFLASHMFLHKPMVLGSFRRYCALFMESMGIVSLLLYLARNATIPK